MGFHLSFTGEHGVLSFLVALADLDGVKVLVELLELQLALGELVEGDTQQAVLMELTDVVETWRGEARATYTLVQIPTHFTLTLIYFINTGIPSLPDFG